jgi:coproporphyrinogen III oxidase, anaerobic (EC 1.3.99.22)
MGLLRELGFNRVSLGVQDLDPAVQRAVNRLQSLEQTRTLIEAAAPCSSARSTST